MKLLNVSSFAFILLSAFHGTCLGHRKDKNIQIEEDRITNLPGISNLPDFAMYSGYLTITEEKKLHYWLNMCEKGPSTTLIVWLNGGPGCSSMDGLFTEHGPFKFNTGTGRLEKNEFSWNKFANTLYIEAPVGVGFSYDLLQEPISDDTVANNLQKALLDFLEKFPDLNDCDIYISGESYAGVYIPTIAAAIVDGGTVLKDKVKGLVIGNGLLSEEVNGQSLVYFAYFHGLFGNALWHNLVQSCCENGRSDRCEFHQFKNEECMLQLAKVMQIVSNEGLNVYNLYHGCANAAGTKMMKFLLQAYEKRFKKFSQNFRKQLEMAPPCSNATLITKYLNDPSVQQALHVKSTVWDICSDHVHSAYQKRYRDMTPFLKRILREMDARVLLYYGDVDMACNHIGGEWFTDELGLKVTMPRRSWSIREEDGSEQVAGFVKELDTLTFATVKGAGHMVPTDKPRAAFFMLQRFLDYEPL